MKIRVFVLISVIIACLALVIGCGGVSNTLDTSARDNGSGVGAGFTATGFSATGSSNSSTGSSTTGTTSSTGGFTAGGSTGGGGGGSTTGL